MTKHQKFVFHWSSYMKIDFNLDLKVQSNAKVDKKNSYQLIDYICRSLLHSN